MKRLHNLDYLRGLAAFAIMIYHFFSWGFKGVHEASFLSRLGLYGVSIFYVLSGLTLCYVYLDNMKVNFADLKSFFLKRFFRIFPLLWLVIVATLILKQDIPSAEKLFLNFTGLFGVFSWGSYIGTGTWSIGNELAFYLFFPLFLLIARKRWLLAAGSIAIFGMYLWFAFYKLDPQHTLREQWVNYVNPLNQVFLFLSGFLLGLFTKNIKVNQNWNHILLGVALVAFIFYPVSDRIDMITGYGRIAFTVFSVAICFAFFKSTFVLPKVAHVPLIFLGEASYSIYLVHPLVWGPCRKVLSIIGSHYTPIPVGLQILICIILTLIASYVVYTKFEKYFMALGKRVTKSAARKPNELLATVPERAPMEEG